MGLPQFVNVKIAKFFPQFCPVAAASPHRWIGVCALTQKCACRTNQSLSPCRDDLRSRHQTTINYHYQLSPNHHQTTINHHQPPSTTINHHQPPSTTINHHQPPSTTINHHQPPSTTINHHQTTINYHYQLSPNHHQTTINHHQPPSTTINHHQPPSTTINPPSTTINHHQPPSTTINHHQPPSTTINHHQPPSTTINHHQTTINYHYQLSPNHHQTTINHHQPPSTTINHHQPPSTTINHHQPPSTTIKPPSTTNHEVGNALQIVSSTIAVVAVVAAAYVPRWFPVVPLPKVSQHLSGSRSVLPAAQVFKLRI